VEGSLNISRVGGPEIYFSQNDFEIIKLFAAQASIALRNADAHLAVSLRASTDALTGLGNHGAFQRTLADLLARPGANGTDGAAPHPVSLLMMDLDNFKPYNDRLGHPAGDALLHAVGVAIRSAARADDLVYRYGGDEFALILPEVAPADAMAIAERARRAVARLTAKELSPVTITIGVATHPADAGDKNGLIGAADTALYYGKQSGGDRVIAAPDVPAEMRNLRGTLDELARAALLNPDDTRAVEHLVGHAQRMGGEGEPTAARDRAERVGSLAVNVAMELGCDENDLRNVELAARLHALELIGSNELRGVSGMREVEEIIRWARRGGSPGW
jgi:diguanylate cyclase (GGDEF)-like protein